MPLDPSPMSQTVTPSRTPCPVERDILYGRPIRNTFLCGVKDILLFPDLHRKVEGWEGDGVFKQI